MTGELYIGGRLADCDADAVAVFTYRRENIDNPTVLRNSYSQQIRLKGTPANDVIFGHYARVDRVTGATSFDASARTPFALYGNGGEIVESGYCKLDAVERKGDDVAYLVTLYGGLGDILYQLGTADDGTPLSLADLRYFDDDPDDFSFTLDHTAVMNAWLKLEVPSTSQPLYGVINFAYTGDPCPDNWAPSKVIAGAGTLAPDCYAAIFEMKDTSAAMTAQQVGDYRCYLMRPVINVKEVLTAIGRYCAAEGWTLDLDAAFFADANPYYAKAWMTLRSFASIGVTTSGVTVTQRDLLGGTLSPYAFLVSYCRQFGLCLNADYHTKRLKVQTRASYYASTLPVLDLSDRLDIGTTGTIRPLTYDERWYLMGLPVVGKTGSAYGEVYRTPYGWKRIDTGFAFNDDAKDLLDGSAFSAAATIQERAVGNGISYPPIFQASARRPGLLTAGPSRSSVATWRGLFPPSGNPSGELTSWPASGVLGHAFTQMTDASGKAVDAYVLIFHDGFDSFGSGTANRIRVTDDYPDMFDEATGGVRCWMVCGKSGTDTTYIGDRTSVPRFSRYMTTTDAYGRTTVQQSWDFAPPQETQVANLTYPEATTLYPKAWADYVGDRYDIDAKVLTARCNLRGLPAPADLLRHFAWWDGALWSVNAVIDWDPFGDGTAKLELVRVKDPANYRAPFPVPSND